MAGKLKTTTKIIYGSGDSGFSFTSTILGAYFAIFLTDVVGLSPGIAAAAVFIGRSWDYVNDPLIGYLSDKTRSKYGRRRPYLLYGALPFAITFAMLWWTPPFAAQFLLAAYYAAAYFLFDTAATFVYMPYFALTPELASGYDERTTLTSYRMFFSIFAGLLAFVIPLAIIGSFRPENAGRVFAMGILFAVASAAPLLLVFLKTEERSEFQTQEKPALKESLKAVFKNRPFLFGLGIYLFTWVAMDIMQVTLLYYLKYNLLREFQSDLILATIFVSAIASLPLWTKLSKRYGKRIAYIGGVAFWGIVQCIIVTFQPQTPLAVILAICVLAGVGVGAAHVLPWSIIPDAIEWDEWKTGKRREGMYYSMVTLVKKIASSLAIPLALLLLETTGYIPNAETQSRGALLVIRLLTGPVPAILLIAGILCAVMYPLSRKQFLEISAVLEERRKGPRQ
ncbi:MAG: MFS transporter [Spirochaetales bacterium]|nr:MFS transporter [Spirochaetales bacterium]